MAFIREVKRGFYANGRPKRYYYLVETYRENGKVKQRQRYLGKEKPKGWGRGTGLPFLTKADEEMIAKAKRDRNPLMNRAGQLARSLAYRLDELDGQGYLYDGGPLSKFMIHSFFVDLTETEIRIRNFKRKWGYGDIEAEYKVLFEGTEAKSVD